MAVREYKARSIQAAVSRIKKDLGPNAMILSLKRVPKGSLDPYGSDMFEVLALSTKEQGEKIGRHNGRHAEHYTGQTDRQAGHYTTGQTDRHTERYAIGPKDRHAEHYAGQTDRQTDRHNGHTDYHNDRRIEKTALASQGVIVESPQKKNAGDGLQEIRDELVSMKDMLKFIDQAKG
ncbi:MAG: hypothetical protein GY850_17475, partial [bacterium]|nr:hypothetical protein [bacterium]